MYVLQLLDLLSTWLFAIEQHFVGMVGSCATKCKFSPWWLRESYLMFMAMGQFEFELMKLSRLLNKNFMTINGNLILNFCLKIIAHTPVLTAGNLGTLLFISVDTILPFEFMTILSYLTYFFKPDVCFVNMRREIRHLL